MKSLLTILLYLFVHQSFSQLSEPDENDVNANQLEDLSQEEEAESENDYELQQLRFFSKHPLDINSADLNQLTLLDPLHISNLSAYRSLLGDIIDIHELQAVPGYNSNLIKSILPYVTVRQDKLSKTSLRTRFLEGEHTLLIRQAFIPELPEGFKSSFSQQFSGSRPALFLRHRYQYRNILQYGFIADKDAGEKLFAKGVLPDFISYHLFARRVGIFKSIALGDYSVNMGQGLIHWQSQAFRKSSSVISIKRQGEILRPYHSAGEYNFLRGAAFTILSGKYEYSLFYSTRKLTSNVNEGVITSFLTSGLHRTPAELNDKKSAGLNTAGVNIKRLGKLGYVGINAICHRYSLPVLKQDVAYNLYAFKGRHWLNVSTDYNHTYRNFHLFGEVALDRNLSPAFINGVVSSLSSSVDVALLHRRISKSYQSIFGNAFTENTMPVNENGLYAGISLKPHLKWKVDFYADLFSFPWLKYRVDAPSAGLGYLVQVIFKPNRQTEIYSRFRYRLKPLNITNDDEESSFPGVQCLQNWRNQISYHVTRSIIIRSRAEVCLFSHPLLQSPQTGYLFFTDLIVKPNSSWLSGNLRFQSFEGESYDTRIYAYENDLLFVSTTPSFYNNGVRYYVNIKANLKVNILNNRQLIINLKIASTVYNNVRHIGSGPAMIAGNRISAIRLQTFLSN